MCFLSKGWTFKLLQKVNFIFSFKYLCSLARLKFAKMPWFLFKAHVILIFSEYLQKESEILFEKENTQLGAHVLARSGEPTL